MGAIELLLLLSYWTRKSAVKVPPQKNKKKCLATFLPVRNTGLWVSIKFLRIRIQLYKTLVWLWNFVKITLWWVCYNFDPPKKAISTDNWVSTPILNFLFYTIQIINNFPAFFLQFFPPGSGSSFRKRSWIWIQDGKLLQIHGDPTPQPWKIYFMQSQALAIPPSLGFGRIFFVIHNWKRWWVFPPIETWTKQCYYSSIIR